MKKILFLFIAILSNLLVVGQTFEGQIIYNNIYTSKNPKITDQQLTSMMGVVQTYTIKGAAYKSVMNGTLVQWQLYNGNENKLYSKMSNSETAFWNDVNIQGDQVIKTELNRNVTDILGFKCDELILTCKSGIQKYYFTPKISADSKLFTNHKYGNWYDYLSIANALPLKSIIETPLFTITTTAKQLIPRKVDVKEFELPSDLKTEKSPY